MGVSYTISDSPASVYAGLNLVDNPGKYQNLLVAGGELGLGLTISVVTLRPLLGLAYATDLSIPLQYQCTSACAGSTSGLLLQPGGLVLVALGHLSFGVDASDLFLVGEGSAGVEVDGQLGARF
jgi:hypothetical protein